MLPETIGPYRIEERLGFGGMGEVYRAYDHRLERRVAVKVIHPEAAGGTATRERFRREARAAAGLAHPRVVQIYDILERPEGDCIVMELVEGETLAELLREGRVPLRRAVPIARDVAEGLAAAHAKGLVHRDLKADNVMITEDGRAKILDFGLAKRLDPSDQDITVSVQGHVVGTSHAMSPEQAQGQEVDHRSDLFSFGSLLYELVTGEAPFRRETLAQTLTWVCTKHPPPAHEVEPAVPEALSSLIDHLLEKDPAHRPDSTGSVAGVLAHLEREVEEGGEAPRSASADLVEALREPSAPTRLDLPRPAYGERREDERTSAGPPRTPRRPAPGSLPPTSAGGPPESATPSAAGRTSRRRAVGVAAGVLVAVVAAAVGAFFARSAAGAVYVAVPVPSISAEGEVPGLDLLPSAVRVALLQELLSLDGIVALAPDQVDAAGGTSVEIARSLAADEVVTARLACEGTVCRATLERVRGGDGSLLWTQMFEVETDDLLRLSTEVGERIRRAYGSRTVRDESEPLDVQSAQYEEFLRIREAFRTRQAAADLEQLLRRAGELRRKAPRFVPAYLLEAEIARSRFTEESRSEDDLRRAFAAIEEARRLAPRNPEPLYTLVDTALEAGRLEQAEAALDKLEELGEDEAAVFARRARLLEQLGRPHDALELMRGAVARRPSESNLLRLADMESRQGEMDRARARLEQLLERSPGSFFAQELLARIELMHGSPARAVELYEEMLARSPGNAAVLNNLAVAYLLLERYEEAAAVSRTLFDQEPNNPWMALNLADAELLAGRIDRASHLYQRVLELTEADPARSDWQVLTVRAQAKAHLGEDTDAVALIQQALQTAPENAQVAFEAALVYALVDETRSALVSAERAVSLGYDPAWFRLPWFDALRSNPEFRELLPDVNPREDRG